MSSVEWNDSDFQKKVKQFETQTVDLAMKALNDIANEVLRLSTFEVPHDTGDLQNSGSVQPVGDEYVVGYHKPYAARLHENPQYHFQKGRKGKYLEDPVKNNLLVFMRFFREKVGSIYH